MLTSGSHVTTQTQQLLPDKLQTVWLSMTALLQEHCADLLIPALAAFWGNFHNTDRNLAYTSEMEPIYEGVREDSIAETNKHRSKQQTGAKPICRG